MRKRRTSPPRPLPRRGRPADRQAKRGAQGRPRSTDDHSTFGIEVRTSVVTVNDDRRYASRPDPMTVLRSVFADLDADQEHLVVLALNGGCDVVGSKVVASGTMDSAPCDPRLIFRHALVLGAARIILAHNHPAGRLDPSREDLEITTRISAAGQLLGCDLVDHIIHDPAARLSFSLRQARPDLFDGSPAPARPGVEPEWGPAVGPRRSSKPRRFGYADAIPLAAEGRLTSRTLAVSRGCTVSSARAIIRRLARKGLVVDVGADDGLGGHPRRRRYGLGGPSDRAR